jgi:hypothetical protein
MVKRCSLESTLESMQTAYKTLVEEKKYQSINQGIKVPTVEIIEQPFSDKVLIKADKSVHVLSRDKESGEFDFVQANLSEPPTSLKHHVTLKVEEKVFDTLFSKVNWNSIFKENNELINAIVKGFFDELTQSAMKVGHYVVMRVTLDHAKLFVDIAV